MEYTIPYNIKTGNMFIETKQIPKIV